MKITVVPLDSRPCNHAWVEKMAAIADIPLSIFPRHLCGTLHNGLDHERLMDWLDNEISSTTHLIVSADGFTSGGLIQARKALFREEDVYARLESFKAYKKKNPALQIIVFDTIMRTSITSYNKETEIYWAMMNQYSKLLGRIELYHMPEDVASLQKLQDSIPASIIQTYLLSREKKHRLNHYFIDQTKAGIVDFVVLLQEDSMKDGIQQVEQRNLQSKILEYGIQHKALVYNGTDEGTLVLLAKVLCQEKYIAPSLFIHVPHVSILSKIMPFEDRSLVENIDRMIQTIGLRKVHSPLEADFILSIYSEPIPYDLDLNATTPILPNKDETYAHFFQQINEFQSMGKKVAFVDLLHPNGGSLELLKEMDIQEIVAYSAWNTSSNSLGSCLANLVVCFIRPEETTISKRFTEERIIDDCIYQTISRRVINTRSSARGYNIFDLGVHAPQVLDEIYQQIKQDNVLLPEVKFAISMPWNRTFEIDIDVE
ncbi:MAG: DUF4127 family protein [bacterium]|nr:DUF4127 family protein [bacterium]